MSWDGIEERRRTAAKARGYSYAVAAVELGAGLATGWLFLQVIVCVWLVFMAGLSFWEVTW